jgi:hypothetical protein
MEHLDLIAATLTAALLKPINYTAGRTDYAGGRAAEAVDRTAIDAVAIFAKVRSALTEKFPPEKIAQKWD